ncbi:MAG: NAD(P)-dependent oxidoreductase [bacterium]
MNNQIISVVTGGSGFVGSHLVDLLLSKGHTVKCIIRNTSNTRWLDGKNVELINSGLYDKTKLKEILKDADYLFHIAGIVKAKSWEDYYKGNVETTKNLLEAVQESNTTIKRIIITSSLTATGPSKIGKPNNESTTPNPITRYGKSKLEEEKLVATFIPKLPITIIRPPAVYGERDTEIYLIFKTYKGGLLPLIGFNKKEVSIVNAKDLVRGMYLAATSPKAVGQTYFIGSTEYYNWNEMGDCIAKGMNRKAITLRIPHFLVYTVGAVAEFFSWFSSKAATFNFEKARDFVQEAQTCDCSKAKNDFGYVSQIPLDKGMKETIEWYKSEKWL